MHPINTPPLVWFHQTHLGIDNSIRLFQRFMLISQSQSELDHFANLYPCFHVRASWTVLRFTAISLERRNKC